MKNCLAILQCRGDNWWYNRGSTGWKIAWINYGKAVWKSKTGKSEIQSWEASVQSQRRKVHGLKARWWKSSFNLRHALTKVKGRIAKVPWNGKFLLIPSQSSVSFDSVWIWSHEHTGAVEQLKQILSSQPVMKLFHSAKPVKLWKVALARVSCETDSLLHMLLMLIPINVQKSLGTSFTRAPAVVAQTTKVMPLSTAFRQMYECSGCSFSCIFPFDDGHLHYQQKPAEFKSVAVENGVHQRLIQVIKTYNSSRFSSGCWSPMEISRTDLWNQLVVIFYLFIQFKIF